MLTRRNRRIRHLVVAFVLAVAAIVAAELAIGSLQARGLESRRARIAAAWGRTLEPRRESDVVRDLRASGVDAVPSIVPYVLILRAAATGRPDRWDAPLLPLAGIARRPTVQLCDDQGARPVIESDEFGFANPPGLWIPGQVDLALLGDSFTHGYCVSADSSYASLIREAWPHTLNLGMGGNGPLAELATLAEYAAPLRPRVVVWQFYENDLADLASESSFPPLAAYLDPGHRQHLGNRQDEVDSLGLAWIDRVYGAGLQVNPVHMYRWRQALRLPRLTASIRRLREPAPHGRPDLTGLGTIWTRASQEVSAWGGHLVLVLVPSWSRYFDPAFSDDGTYAAVARLAQSLAIEVLDLDPLVRAAGPSARDFSRLDLAHGHFSESGYRLMAAAVRDRVVQRGWLVAPGMQTLSPE